MNFLIVLVFVSFMTTAWVFGQFVCPEWPNTIQVGCNDCKCQEGNIFDCTKYQCRDEPNLPLFVNCVENEVKWDDCEFCKCRQENWECFNIPCTHTNHSNTKKDDSGSRRKRYIEGYCVEGTKQKQDCKDCTCIDLYWQCDNKDCRKIDFVKEELKGFPCLSFDEINIDCNICRCRDDIEYVCRRLEICPGTYSRVFLRGILKYIKIMEEKDFQFKISRRFPDYHRFH